MKFNFLLVNLCLIVGALNAQSHKNKLDNLGIISELVHIKNIAETATAIVIVKSTDQNQKEKITATYNTLKNQIDQFVLQLIADMNQRNSIKLFKKLNKCLKDKAIANITEKDVNNDWLKTYVQSLKKINVTFNELIKQATEGTTRVAVEEITGPVELLMSIIKQLSDQRAAKVGKISEIVDKLRLVPAAELSKKKEENK